MKEEWCEEYYAECASYLGLSADYCTIHAPGPDENGKENVWSYPINPSVAGKIQTKEQSNVGGGGVSLS